MSSTVAPTPELIFDTMQAYQRTAALRAGIELEIFTAIAEGATITSVTDQISGLIWGANSGGTMTIDVLSGGRLFVGVGVGWLAEEFAVMDTPPFAARGAVTDEWLQLFVKLWTEENPTFEGTHYQVRDIGCFPKPLQKPHPPIFVGGNSHAAIRRATRYGQSWHAFRMPVEELRARVGYLRAQVGASGRPADACGFSVRYGIRVVGPRGEGYGLMLQLKRLEVEGFGPFAERQVLDFPAAPGVTVVYGENMRGKTSLLNAIRSGSQAAVLETMERLADEVWPKLGTGR